jgi:hypothetical protein
MLDILFTFQAVLFLTYVFIYSNSMGSWSILTWTQSSYGNYFVSRISIKSVRMYWHAASSKLVPSF